MSVSVRVCLSGLSRCVCVRTRAKGSGLVWGKNEKGVRGESIVFFTVETHFHVFLFFGFLDSLVSARTGGRRYLFRYLYVRCRVLRMFLFLFFLVPVLVWGVLLLPACRAQPTVTAQRWRTSLVRSQ